MNSQNGHRARLVVATMLVTFAGFRAVLHPRPNIIVFLAVAYASIIGRRSD